MTLKPQSTVDSVPHLLIASPDAADCQRLRVGLQPDYRITTVTSGELALEAIAQTPFQLVILDVMIGRPDGFGVLEAVRQTPEAAGVPVIMLSPLARSEDTVRGLQLGASDWVGGPLDVEVVRARVERQLIIQQELDDRQAVITYLQDAHEMKDQFLRIATHDLKSPLNNIRLAQYYLRELVGDNAQARAALDAIEETVAWMNSLVEDFLDTSMLRSGSGGLRREAINAEDMIWNVADQYSASANQKGLTLLFGMTDGVVWADRSRLRQIIANLVSNAIKYSPRDRFVTLSSEVRGERVRFSVADEGPGIALQEQKGLFQVFSRLSSRPTAGESSSGLGLWIVKELVELQGGEVGVECPTTGGSVFWFELPRCVPPFVEGE